MVQRKASASAKMRYSSGVKTPICDQVLGGLGVVEVLADPEQRLQVAQAALALLDVRLEQVARAALAGVALGALGELELDELGPGAVEELAPEPGVEPVGERRRRPRGSGARAGWCGW